VSDAQNRKTLEDIEIEMLQRHTVTIPAKDWERFKSWAAQPAREIAGLKELFAKTPTLAEVTPPRPYRPRRGSRFD